MKHDKRKKGRRIEQDYIIANRKKSREKEIIAHGKLISFRESIHQSRKKYNRKRIKRTIIHLDDSSFYKFNVDGKEVFGFGR